MVPTPGAGTGPEGATVAVVPLETGSQAELMVFQIEEEALVEPPAVAEKRARSTITQQVMAVPTARTTSFSCATGVSAWSSASMPRKCGKAPTYWTVSGARS